MTRADLYPAPATVEREGGGVWTLMQPDEGVGRNPKPTVLHVRHTETLPGLLFVLVCEQPRRVKCRQGAADGSSATDRVTVSRERVVEEPHGANLKSRQ